MSEQEFGGLVAALILTLWPDNAETIPDKRLGIPSNSRSERGVGPLVKHGKSFDVNEFERQKRDRTP